MSSHIWPLAFFLLASSAAQADILHVSDFSGLVDAIDTANMNSGSTIYLAPGTYTGGALPNIMQSVTLALDPAFGAAAGAAVLDTVPTGAKGILTIPSGTNGVNLTIEGLTLENASVSAADGGNGAGIRDQSSGASSLLVSDSFFLNNQDGILTGDGGAPAQEQLAVSITGSVFANNGSPDGFEHAVYIFGQSLSISGSLFCGTVAGHDVKSRAAVTTISDSQLLDGASGGSFAGCGVGSSSYAVDAPNGGQLSLVNDTLSQGAATENSAIVSYGEDGLDFANNALLAAEDVFFSSITGVGIQELSNDTPTCLVPVQLSGSSFSSDLTPVNPPGCTAPEQPVSEPTTVWLFWAGLLALIAASVPLELRRPAVARYC